MEDKGQMNEVIEQMKLMNVLLSKRDKREETKENDMKWVSKVLWFGVFLVVLLNLVPTPKNEVNKSHTPPMYNSPSQQNTEKKRHSLLHREAENSYETDE